MKNHMSRFIMAALSAGALALVVHNATAQDSNTAVPQAQSTPMEVDDATVSKFVNAYTKVREIHTEYAQRLQGVEDPQQASDLQQEAQEKMEEAVTSNDISVEQYMKIARQISQDAQLRSRIQAELQTSQGS